MSKENNYRILVVDDSPAIHEDFKKILHPADSTSGQNLDEMNQKLFGHAAKPNTLPPFQLDFALQGQEGVDLVQKALAANKPYAVLFLDVQMPPGKDGVEALQYVWNIDPNLQVVICTAYAKYTWQDINNKFGETDRIFVLKKPFDPLEILQLATSLSKKWNLHQTMNDQLLLLKKMNTNQNPAVNKSLNTLKESIEALNSLNKKLQE
jgi:CheY-like chemotaxis protein